MGEDPATILGIGCPSSDIALRLNRTLPPEVPNGYGSGAVIDVSKPFLLVTFHPTTTEYGGERAQINELLAALGRLELPTVLMWPNIDAGSDHVSKAIRCFRDVAGRQWLRLLTNVSPEHYQQLLACTACAIGNSSSFVRDAGFFGTPVVLVGDRQAGRETDSHVTKVAPQAEAIVQAIQKQRTHGRYSPSHLYGSGQVSDCIADKLAQLKPYSQKRLHYCLADNADNVAQPRLASHLLPAQYPRSPLVQRTSRTGEVPRRKRRDTSRMDATVPVRKRHRRETVNRDRLVPALTDRRAQRGLQGDRRLVARCLAGDAAAWSHMYDRFQDPVQLSIRSSLGEAGNEFYLVNAISARVWQALVRNDFEQLHRFQAHIGSRLSTFILGIAARESRRFLTARRAAAASDVSSAPGASLSDVGVTHGNSAMLPPTHSHYLQAMEDVPISAGR
jgi:hypothetical protein